MIGENGAATKNRTWDFIITNDAFVAEYSNVISIL